MTIPTIKEMNDIKNDFLSKYVRHEMVMWIARDKDEELWLFKRKPQKQNAGFWSVESITDIIIMLPKQIFPEVKWEDKEPRELILK